jgi:hypothetical protein
MGLTSTPVKRKHPLAECEIPLTNGGIALVDSEDYAEVMQHKWYRMDVGRTSYARQTGHLDGKQFMHQFVLNVIEEIDHIDGDGLNNRRDNLRKVTHQQNSFRQRKRKGSYTSIYKGVYRKPSGKWVAQICIAGKSKNLGTFPTEEAAALAYNEAAKEVFGAYARTNDL